MQFDPGLEYQPNRGDHGRDGNSWLLLCSALTDGPYSYIWISKIIQPVNPAQSVFKCEAKRKKKITNKTNNKIKEKDGAIEKTAELWSAFLLAYLNRKELTLRSSNYNFDVLLICFLS